MSLPNGTTSDPIRYHRHFAAGATRLSNVGDFNMTLDLVDSLDLGSVKVYPNLVVLR